MPDTQPEAPKAPDTVTIGGSTYKVHAPKSAARAASVFSSGLDAHVMAAAIIGLCVDCHGVPWQGKAQVFGERVFDALQAKRVGLESIHRIGGQLTDLAASVILFEQEVAGVEDFIEAPQAG